MIAPDRAAEITRAWRNDPVDQMRREKRRREMMDRRRRPASPAPDPRRELSARIESAVAERLRALGYAVEPTGHNERFDLLVEDCLRIEVKAARWQVSSGRGRYQANLRGNRADLVIFVAVTGPARGADFYFVIPAGLLSGRRSITLRCHNPHHYSGQYSAYREAWQLVGPALESARKEEL